MMRRRFAAAILITGLAGMLSALPCFSFTVMDKTGKEVEISPPVGRVILLSLYELIPVLDLWDRVVGINRWALDNELLKRHPQLAGIPAVGTGEAVNIEAVIALEPELVITWSYKPEVAEFLSRKGLKTLSVYPESLDELYRAIEMCGVIFHVEDRAREVERLMKEMFESVRSKVSAIPEEARRRVLWIWQKPTRVSGSIGIQHELIVMTGGINPASHLHSKHPEVSPEWILMWDPEVIFIWGNARYGPESILNNPQWKTVRAVKDRKVYKAPSWSTWSPSIGLLALWMAMKTYPEVFDPASQLKGARQYHQACFGIPLDEAVFHEEVKP